MGGVEAVGWLAEGSVEAVRGAIAGSAPELAGEPIVVAPPVPGNPRPYWRGTARVGERYVAKFAWSSQAAAGLDRELQALGLLARQAPTLPVPEVVHASRAPLLFLTRYVPGAACAGPYAERPPRLTIADQLAAFLARLHDPTLCESLRRGGLEAGETRPQASTSDLRHRFAGPVVDGARAARVRRWCDWVDDVQGAPVAEATVVHGDLHSHNLVVSEDGGQLLLVADFENVAVGDPHYDFRYLVSVCRDLDWFEACRAEYQRQSGRTLSIARVMAWHVRTALGDALWRAERGVELPGGLTPDGYVDDIAHRLNCLDMDAT